MTNALRVPRYRIWGGFAKLWGLALEAVEVDDQSVAPAPAWAAASLASGSPLHLQPPPVMTAWSAHFQYFGRRPQQMALHYGRHTLRASARVCLGHFPAVGPLSREITSSSTGYMPGWGGRVQINGACGMLQLVFTSAKKSVIALQCLVRPRWTLRLALAHTLVKWQKPNWRFPPGPEVD